MSLISRVPMRSVTSFVRQFSVSCRSLKSEAGEGGCGVSSKQAEILKQKTPVGKSELSSVEIISSLLLRQTGGAAQHPPRPGEEPATRVP